MVVSIVYDKSELKKIHGALSSILVGQAHYYFSLLLTAMPTQILECT